jgi:hypothetical protein
MISGDILQAPEKLQSVYLYADEQGRTAVMLSFLGFI